MLGSNKYFGPLLFAFDYEFCGLDKRWKLHTSTRNEINNEFSVLRHPACQYCRDTSHIYTIYHVLQSHSTMKDEKRFLVENATQMYNELDSIFNLSNGKEAKRVRFNAPPLPQPKLKNIGPRHNGKICEVYHNTQHPSYTCYYKNPRNMYLYPPGQG
jgi:hypothetical protein